MGMADVTRTGELDKMAAWRMDWTAKWGGEPFWRATAALDMEPMAREAGFVDVRGYHPQPGRDPYVIYGRKPACAAATRRQRGGYCPTRAPTIGARGSSRGPVSSGCLTTEI